MIEECSSINKVEWLGLRSALRPHSSTSEHLAEMDEFISKPQKYVQFIARSESGEAIGFVEASIRTDYVNGTKSSPVGFIEGLFVSPDYRRCGIAGKLVSKVLEWAKAVGLNEIGSDVLLDNEVSHAMHIALGFSETERVVYFRKELS